MFIDTLRLRVETSDGQCLRCVLRDDGGNVCRTLEAEPALCHEVLDWNGLNDLPYGRYTLELSRGEEAFSVDLVKRV
jgi:hypothetical protein